VSPAAWLVLTVVGATPLGAVVWFRWRFGAKRMDAAADRHLANAKARMAARDDAALLALIRGAPLGHAPAAKRLRGLVDEGRYAELPAAWSELLPELLEKKMPLDDALDLAAAVAVLAERHPTRAR
jgi:hypothetical protein